MKSKMKSPDIGGGTHEKPYSWRREMYGDEVNILFERYTEGDPNVELVSMNDGKSVEVNLDDEEKTIFTHGLGGCYGTLVFTEHENGVRNGVLTHYAPTQISRNMARLRELISQRKDMREAKIKQTIVMGIGEWVQDPKTKKYSLESAPESKQKIDAIILSIQAELGNDVEVKFEPYERAVSAGAEDQGVLVAKIPPKSKGDAQFKTEYGFKKLGNKEK